MREGKNPSVFTTGGVFAAPLLIYMMAFSDTFGGIFQGIFPLSLILRSIITALLLLYALSRSAKRMDIQILWFVTIAFFLLRILLDYYAVLDHRVVALETSATLRLLYFPLLLSYLLVEVEKNRFPRNKIRRCLLLYGWMVLASLFLGEITGLGGTIGGRGEGIEAGKGFMIGANEVGLMLLLTAPFVGRSIVQKTRNVLLGGITQLFIYGLAGLHVFTKSSLIASMVALYSVYRTFMSRGIIFKVGLWAAMSGLLLFLFISLSENVKVIYELMQGTFLSSLTEGDILSFIFRGRENYINAIYPLLINDRANWFFFLFGAGEFFIREISVGPLMLEPGQGTMFEMDFFDAFAAYGLVGCFLYALTLGTLVKQAGPRRFPREITVALLCVAGHSFLAGHVLFSPQVTTLVVLVLLYYRVDKQDQDSGSGNTALVAVAEVR